MRVKQIPSASCEIEIFALNDSSIWSAIMRSTSWAALALCDCDDSFCLCISLHIFASCIWWFLTLKRHASRDAARLTWCPPKLALVPQPATSLQYAQKSQNLTSCLWYDPWSRCWVRRIHGHCILVLICCLYSQHLRASSEACICLLHSAFCTAVKENYIRQELLGNPQHKPASRPRAKHPGASCFNLVCANPEHIRNRAKFQGIYSMIPSPQHACCPYWRKVLWTLDTEDCWCNRPGDPISQVSKKANEPVGSNFLRSIRSCTPRTCRFQYTFQDSHQSSLFNLRFFLRNYILALLTPLGSMESIQSTTKLVHLVMTLSWLHQQPPSERSSARWSAAADVSWINCGRGNLARFMQALWLHQACDLSCTRIGHFMVRSAIFALQRHMCFHP